MTPADLFSSHVLRLQAETEKALAEAGYETSEEIIHLVRQVKEEIAAERT